MEFTGIREGSTDFFVPVQDMDDNFPPGTAPVFFNRRMELNRDATVLLCSVLRPSDYLDAMGATGVRGIRVGRECGIPVTINDRNPDAISLIRTNVSRSGLPAEVVSRDINALLSERSFDAVDLDPFGSPAPFIDAGVRGSRRFLFVTATDTAPLCGAHRKAGMRRYFAQPVKTDYHSEVGLRILLGFVVRETVKYDRGIEPLFCFAREHFVRLHLRITRGAAAADRALGRIGYIMQCGKCQHREEEKGMIPQGACCPLCGEPLQPIGPLYLGSIQDHRMLEALLEQIDALELGTKKELKNVITVCNEELPTSSFYDYHRIAKSLKVSPPDIGSVLERIRTAGFGATRTHFSGYGIKTDAPVPEIQRAISAR
ncbi:MAG: tRNA (guanine(26)-N(2))-dimethyltransferase [Methanoregula sp. PtaU1.Bin051]|nr:MAG: tRNA (guanine(26)-N(2))-dimethyltransferase [Methanoregula sp. PtaU1.Bin051]